MARMSVKIPVHRRVVVMVMILVTLDSYKACQDCSWPDAKRPCLSGSSRSCWCLIPLAKPPGCDIPSVPLEAPGCAVPHTSNFLLTGFGGI